MSYATPNFEDDVVDDAGSALSGDWDAIDRLGQYGYDVLEVVNNWRAAHAYPLNTFTVTLRNRARKVEQSAVVAQRIKRLSSIEAKLDRLTDLSLATMQDIAGCRVIFDSVEKVNELTEMYRRGYSTHVLERENDYIGSPKSDGYRGRHLIYRYSPVSGGAYSGLRIEMQIRSQLQHCWATAVEIADIYYREGLKSHRGSPEWRRFFALMGSAIAIREGSRRVPHTPRNDSELYGELRDLAEELDVLARFSAFGNTLRVINENRPPRWLKYVVLVLDPNEETTRLYAYTASDVEAATREYASLERLKRDGADAVLVSVSDATSLRRAYPNYFLDTTAFLDAVRLAIR